MRLSSLRPALAPTLRHMTLLGTTLLSTALLLALPALWLLSHPRRVATGLERLLPSAALLQSFPARSQAAPPPLWQQRLGAAAPLLWSQQRHLWWQYWGTHGDAGAYLVIQAPTGPTLPPHALRLDDLLVVAPDPLARQLLKDQLKVRYRPPRGLALRCMQQLRQRQAVLWNPTGLTPLLGPLAPLALDLQQGCLVLSGDQGRLQWQGEAEASQGVVAAEPPPLALQAAPPLPAAQLLELQGSRLELLLRGVMGSGVLRQSLETRYGLGPDPLAALQAAPFVLQLRSVASGPFRAGLTLLLQPGAARRPALERWLQALEPALEDQGLRRVPATQSALTLWSREDGTVVGGWRWLTGARLQLFLGPVSAADATAAPTAGWGWRLRLRPAALASAGLLPQDVPVVVRRAEQLVLQGRPVGSRGGERRSALAGSLQLR